MIALALLMVLAVGVFAAPTKVTFWTTYTPPWSDYLQKMVDVFNLSQTGVQVEMTMVPGSETDVSKLITAVRGGTGPDVYMLDRFTTAERKAAGPARSTWSASSGRWTSTDSPPCDRSPPCGFSTRSREMLGDWKPGGANCTSSDTRAA